MRFKGDFPFFDCKCGELKLGGKPLIINGALNLECQACGLIYQFDCRLTEQTFTREQLQPVVAKPKEQEHESGSQSSGT